MASPLVSRTAFVLLSLLSFTLAQSIPGASFLSGNGAPGAGQYGLVDDYEGSSNFFNKFNYYSSYDPTYGHVQYVNESVAVQNGYTKTSKTGTAVIGVDSTNLWPNGGPGRPSVRLISDNTYTHGLFILDVIHMPWGCGTWPAYWLLGPNWPYNGEIDIIEGVNTIGYDSVTLHTSHNCTISGGGQTGTFQTDDCSGGCGSILSTTATPNNYGEGFNANGGGVYATEWTSDYIKTWFFPRNSIPASITNGAPSPNSDFGEPAVNSEGPCSFDQHFNNMSIIINIDFCGAWAGQVYESQYPNCPQNASAPNSLDSCVDFVGLNPQNFTTAYWEINSIKVYQMPLGAKPSSTYSTSLSSTMPQMSTQTIQKGMGGTTSTLSSSPYTGPLSSASSTTASMVSSTGSSPPSEGAACPIYNNTVWTDIYGQQYAIHCGSDYNGVPASVAVQPATSFEECLEYCDSLMGCRAAAFSGTTCYPKSGVGVFNYVGTTDSGVRLAGPVSMPISSTSSYSASTSSSALVSSSAGSSTPSSSILVTGKTSSTSSPPGTSPSSVVSIMASASYSIVALSTQPSSSVSIPVSSVLAQSSSSLASTSLGLSSSSLLAGLSSGFSAASMSPSATTQMSSSSALPSCEPSTCSSASSNSHSTCQDPYNNPFNVTCGVRYTGLSLRTAKAANLNVCLVKCDLASGCAAVNYANGSCNLLAAVTGTVAAPRVGGFAAATRLADVTTVHSEPPKTASNGLSTLASHMSSLSSAKAFSSGLTRSTTPSSTVAGSEPPCPTSTTAICEAANGTITCSGSDGDTYKLTCDVAYTGPALSPSNPQSAQRLIKRTSELTIGGCEALCHDTAGCVALNYDQTNCILLSAVYGITYVQGAVAGSVLARSTAQSTSGHAVTVTPTSYLGISTLSLRSGATVTVTPIHTVTSLLPPGSRHHHSTVHTSGSVAVGLGGGGGGSISLCYTCGLTPTVITGSPTYPSKGHHGVGSTGNHGTCTALPPLPGIGTTTIFTTHTITSCGVPQVCPAPGYIIGGNATQSGATVVTTTNARGHTVTYTQIPTGPAGQGGHGAGRNGQGGNPGQGSGGTGTSKGTPTTSIPTNTAQPTCPLSNDEQFTSQLGMQYLILCNEAFSDDNVDVQYAGSLASCISACDMFNLLSFMVASPCLGITYTPSGEGKNCELKSGSTAEERRGADSARLLSPYPGPGHGNGTGTGGGSGVGVFTGSTNLTTIVSGGSTQLSTYVTGGSTYLSTYVTGGSTQTETFVTDGHTNLRPFVTDGMTETSTVIKGGHTYLSTVVSGGKTKTGTFVTGGSTVVKTHVQGGHTIIATVTEAAGGTGNGHGGNGGVGGNGGSVGTGNGHGGNGGSRTGSGNGNGGTGGSKNGGSGNVRGTATATIPGQAGTSIVRVPQTLSTVITEVSTYVSNGVTRKSTYGVTTAYSVRYVSVTPSPNRGNTRTVTTTTTTVSISISISNQVSTVTGPTVTNSGYEVTLTEGGSQFITVTAPPSYIISYVYPSSSASSFTCRTYATNYLNGYHGKVKRTNKRSVFDIDAPLLLGEMAPKPGAVPLL